MGEITDLSKGKIKMPGGAIKELGGIPGATSKLNEAKGLVDSINSTINSVQKLLGPVIERAQGQQQVNKIPSPTQQEQAMSPNNDIIRLPEKQQLQSTNNDQMETYFSSPEGLQKIADAIDKFIPLIGDAKLSEVKDLIQSVNPGKEKKK
jgi:phosphoenolpyruvate carboxylase